MFTTPSLDDQNIIIIQWTSVAIWESLRPAASPGHGAVYFSVTSSAPRRTGRSGRSSSSSSFTAMDDTSASAFSTAMDDTSASVFMTWTTSARFTDAPGPKVIALTAARYQPHPSFRTALLSSEHARSSPQGSTTAPRRPAVHPATKSTMNDQIRELSITTNASNTVTVLQTE